MIVCDLCKIVPIVKNKAKTKPYDYQIVGTKVEDPSTKSAAKKAIAREVVKIDLHLCDDCITIFNQRLGAFIHAMKTNEPMDLENDLSKPVGVTEHADVDSRAVVDPPKFNTAGTLSGRIQGKEPNESRPPVVHKSQMTSGLPNPAPDNIAKGSPEAAAAFDTRKGDAVATKTLAGSDTYGNE